METTKKATNIAEMKTVPFQMKKTLIPIDHYAQREEISIEVVEQCAKVGLLQIRRCKGEVFVVDTPLDAFGERDEILADINRQIKERQNDAVKPQAPKQRPKNIAKPKPQTNPIQTAKPAVKPPRKAEPKIVPQAKLPGHYKTVANDLAKNQQQNKIAKPAPTLDVEIDEPIEIDEIINTEILSNKKTEVKPEDFGLDINEIDELLNEKDLLLDYQQSYYNKNRKHINPQKNWTTAAIISALCLSFSLMCCFWLYLDSQMQRDKISNLRTDNVKLQKSVSIAKKQTAGIRSEFADSNRRISELNEQINNLKKELANTKDQLKLTLKQLEQASQKTK